jgi:hypothetical protein
MSYSVSLEENSPQQYKLKIMSELLVQAHILGLDLEEFVGFFATQVQAMLASPPNYCKFGKKARVWIMRGFYPGTTLFFKLTLVTCSDNTWGTHSYYAKASPIRVLYYGKHGSYDDHITLDSNLLNESITNRMENAFFNAEHELKPILEKKLKMPRCMSPKGMQIFNYKKPKTKKGK